MVEERNPGILPDLPPSELVQGEAQQFIVDYLRRYGPNMTGFRISEHTDNKQVSGPSMPGYIHMALSQIAAHPALPYRGNVTALIRNLIYIGLGAHAHVLSQYNAEDPSHEFTTNIITRMDTMRESSLLTLLDRTSVYTLINSANHLAALRQVGAYSEMFQHIQRLFYDADKISSPTWRNNYLKAIAKVPEVVNAMNDLNQHPMFRGNQELEIWMQRLDELTDRTQELTG